MKKILVFLVVAQLIVISCTNKNKETKTDLVDVPVSFLPFKTIDLNDKSGFLKNGDNWQIVEDAYVDRKKDKSLSGTPGTGVLINLPTPNSKDHLFTAFEHGDIEVEVDVMMPVNSNSGLYFQGRYEIQLFDSWGVLNPTAADMGGIYQRWDNERAEEKGYEGHAPHLNAAKAPGLWQHFRIVFHAPKFNPEGEKIKNAVFKEVWLNNQLLHENVEVTGPTRAAAFTDEKPLGPFMIQGDHGPVAIKNLKYKLYGENRVTLTNLKMTEYDSKSETLPGLDTITSLRTLDTDSISALMATGERPRKILEYKGELEVPTTGDYVFNYKVNVAGGFLLLNNDTIIKLDQNFNGYAKIALQKGKTPFALIYNKYNGRTSGLGLSVEGPEMEKHDLHAKNSFVPRRRNPKNDVIIEVKNEPVTQRSYLMHKGEKRTHVISVGMPEGVSYAYDLELGSLLKVWDGQFLDATHMWYVRGIEQLGVPNEFNISFTGNPDFAFLEDERTVWPDSIASTIIQKQLGYEFDATGIPTFSYQMNESTIANKIEALKNGRGFKRVISIAGSQEIWFKMADGKEIKKLPDGTYVIRDENYFIDFSTSDGITPIIRNVNGKDELLVKIAPGNKSINYNIIW
ncbi:DUF1080 domain-containing protein [Cellulophaga sp. F20128]|uniref:3-keto-disaccharide hydrolase n=1 Tax=Cellulophaga sp. F20128 TaxID=2926413 RepID=UPI001FF4A575|nr:DUF1080 domain-containing protein [Cellulophaga sp. F20128]MCK0156460.1 DUF1080 domain-containing protein [Cellulophaga sp. F20128]